MDPKISLVICGILVFSHVVCCLSYLDDDETEQTDSYFEGPDALMETAQKRSCIRRGGSCDHRPNDCCFNSSCRCNLWGSNCRCQRAGLFQKWGK